MELCKKDLDYVGRAEQDSVKDVKKTPNMKLPLHFYSTFEKVCWQMKGVFHYSVVIESVYSWGGGTWFEGSSCMVEDQQAGRVD